MSIHVCNSLYNILFVFFKSTLFHIQVVSCSSWEAPLYAEILSIRHKTLSNQSINQSIKLISRKHVIKPKSLSGNLQTQYNDRNIDSSH